NVTGVQTCALPIWHRHDQLPVLPPLHVPHRVHQPRRQVRQVGTHHVARIDLLRLHQRRRSDAHPLLDTQTTAHLSDLRGQLPRFLVRLHLTAQLTQPVQHLTQLRRCRSLSHRPRPCSARPSRQPSPPPPPPTCSGTSPAPSAPPRTPRPPHE